MVKHNYDWSFNSLFEIWLCENMLRSPAHIITSNTGGLMGFNSHPTTPTHSVRSATTSLFDSCHRKFRLIGGGPVAFLGGLVA